jgi:N-acetyl-alpha-D-muramate 1-phosphate uridylyltransferase
VNGAAGNLDTAMVMAAGHGARMRPLTDDRSKAMVEIGGLPLIEHMLRRLEHAGIARAVVNVHAYAEALENYLRNRNGQIETIISDERDALLETGGGVVKALPLLGRRPFLICNIDAVWVEREGVLTAMMRAWEKGIKKNARQKSLLLLAALERTMGYAGAGDFNRDIDGKITRRTSAYAPYVYAGVEISRPENFTGFNIEKFSRTKVWDSYPEGLFGHIMDGHWLHVGDPQAHKMAQDILRDPRNPWRAIA